MIWIMAENIIFKRKLYRKLLHWKQESNGESSILIEGARRVGKSTLARQFAKNEYKSFIFIDFSNVKSDVKRLFEDVSNLDMLFTQLQFEYGVQLYKRESVIVLDEIQLCPPARQARKHLVADGRYDYIETGSLISITKNVKNILIPSEEDSVNMYPLDFEEFLYALGDTTTSSLLRNVIQQPAPLGQVGHRKMMELFRLYMLIGGMPQAVSKYIETRNMTLVDGIKRKIIKLYLSDFHKIDGTGRISRLFEDIPAQLLKNNSRYMPRTVIGSKISEKAEDSYISELASSMTVNMCYHTANPANGLAMDYDKDYFKMFVGDTGLFITLAFYDKEFTDNIIYQKLLHDKLDVNLGYVFENVVAQMLAAAGKKLFYYTFPAPHKHIYEIDFLLSDGHKIRPIEVKSAGYNTHSSIDAFCDKYPKKIKTPTIIYAKDYKAEAPYTYMPIYLLPFMAEKI